MALPMKKVTKAAAMKTTMKAMKQSMKQSMKTTMKAKRASKIARGKRAKSAVFSGRKEKTSGGLKREGLVKSSTGKVVSKKASALAKRRYNAAGSKLKKWTEAVKAARKALGITGFVCIGGKSAAGKAIYAKAKALMAA